MRLNYAVLTAVVALYASNDLVAAETTRDLLSFGDFTEERSATKAATKTSNVVSDSGSDSESGVTQVQNSDVTQLEQDASESDSSSLAGTKSTKPTKATKVLPTKKKAAVTPASGSSDEASGSEDSESGDDSGLEDLLASTDMSGSELSGSELDALLSSLGGSGLGDFSGSDLGLDLLLSGLSDSDSGSDLDDLLSSDSASGDDLTDLLSDDSESDSGSSVAIKKKKTADSGSSEEPSTPAPTTSTSEGSECPTGFFGHLKSWWKNKFGNGDKCALMAKSDNKSDQNKGNTQEASSSSGSSSTKSKKKQTVASDSGSSDDASGLDDLLAGLTDDVSGSDA